MQVQSLGSLSGLRIWCCHKLWHRTLCRCSLDPVLPWLWHGPAAAALMQPLAWELTYDEDVTVKIRGKKRAHSLKEKETKNLTFSLNYNTFLLLLNIKFCQTIQII